MLAIWEMALLVSADYGIIRASGILDSAVIHDSYLLMIMYTYLLSIVKISKNL